MAEVSYVMRVHVEKKFIGFSADQTSLKIYSYQAPRGSSWAWRTRRSASGSGTRSSSEEFSSCSTTCSEQMKKVIPLHGQRALRDRGLGRLRARGAARADVQHVQKQREREPQPPQPAGGLHAVHRGYPGGKTL